MKNSGEFFPMEPANPLSEVVSLLEDEIEDLVEEFSACLLYRHALKRSGLLCWGLRAGASGLRDRGSETCSCGQTCPDHGGLLSCCLLYTSPSPRDKRQSRMPSSA